MIYSWGKDYPWHRNIVLSTLDTFDSKHLESKTTVFFFAFSMLAENNSVISAKLNTEVIIWFTKISLFTYHKSFTLPYIELSTKKNPQIPQNLRRHISSKPPYRLVRILKHFHLGRLHWMLYNMGHVHISNGTLVRINA